MTLGSLAGGLLLLAWAQVETPGVFYLLWVLMGAATMALSTGRSPSPRPWRKPWHQR
jgi:hypothetical protein